MSYSQLLSNLGFEADPFAKTNADEEERLDRYFTPPPFFNAVFGDLAHPKSAVVFAPRGGGKTAQKRKIELQSTNEPLLCCTYNTFDIVGRKLEDIDLNYHLNNVIRRVLVGVLTALRIRGVSGVSNEDRHLLYLMTKAHLAKLGQSELRESISAVKTFGDQAKEWWNTFTGPVGIVLNGLLSKVGFPAADIQRFETDGGTLGALLDQLGFLRRIAQILGFKCIYILVDRVDENQLTNAKGSNAFRFIEPLLTDLQVLELDSVSFKFFLWDLLLDDYRAVARPDRVKNYVLEWNHGQLQTMLGERLKAHSGGKVSSLSQICPLAGRWNLDQLVCLFAQGSPRTVIRICKAIIDQQSELNADASNISEKAVDLGFNEIASNISKELFKESVIRDIQRTKKCDFTIKNVAAAFRISSPAAVNKVRSWEDAGAVISLGTIQETAGAKPSNHYGIAHWLLAKHLFPELAIAAFADSKVLSCPECARVLLRDWEVGPQTCHHCQADLPIKIQPF